MANAAKAQANLSKGARALAEWAKKNGHTSYAAAGRALGVPWHRYRRWETGECTPLVTDAVMLEKKCKIPTSAWFE